MLIIGLGHRARQGKNTAAVAMVNAGPIGQRARFYAYADALRAEVRAAINEAGGLQELVDRGYVEEWKGRGINYAHFPEWVRNETGKPRTLLQWWGTDYRRAQDPNYWVKRLMETLERDQPEVALVTDVRFPNEVDAIHAAGGVVIKVTRTTPPDVKVPEHPSESVLDDYAGWDFEIKAATATELRKQARSIYKKIVRKNGI